MTAHAALVVLSGATLVLGIAVPLLRSWRHHHVFAVERPRTELQRFLHAAFAATMAGYGLWTGVLVVVGPASLGVAAVPRGVAGVGLAVGFAGLALVLLAQAHMGGSWRIGIAAERTDLVTSGVFRWSRNPIYLGMLGVAAGIALVAPSGWTLVGLALVHVLTGFQARAEEEHLLAVHGADFRAWARRTGRMVPGLGRLR